MADEREPKAPLGVTFGKVMGTAGMVAGTALLGAAIASAFGAFNVAEVPVVDDASVVTPATGVDVSLSSRVGDFFSQANEWMLGAADRLKNGFTTDFTNMDPAKTAAFGGAVGVAGFALHEKMENKAEASVDAQHEEIAMKRAGGGFAAREQERAIAGLMQARLMATNPEYFAQMGQGRGA